MDLGRTNAGTASVQHSLSALYVAQIRDSNGTQSGGPIMGQSMHRAGPFRKPLFVRSGSAAPTEKIKVKVERFFRSVSVRRKRCLVSITH